MSPAWEERARRPRLELRSPGAQFRIASGDGGNIQYVYNAFAQRVEKPVCGVAANLPAAGREHFGEHNPYSRLGVGFILHCVSDRAGYCQ